MNIVLLASLALSAAAVVISTFAAYWAYEAWRIERRLTGRVERMRRISAQLTGRPLDKVIEQALRRDLPPRG